MELKTACSCATVSARVCSELAAELSGLPHTGESGSLLNRRQQQAFELCSSMPERISSYLEYNRLYNGSLARLAATGSATARIPATGQSLAKITCGG